MANRLYTLLDSIINKPQITTTYTDYTKPSYTHVVFTSGVAAPTKDGYNLVGGVISYLDEQTGSTVNIAGNFQLLLAPNRYKVANNLSSGTGPSFRINWIWQKA